MFSLGAFRFSYFGPRLFHKREIHAPTEQLLEISLLDGFGKFAASVCQLFCFSRP